MSEDTHECPNGCGKTMEEDTVDRPTPLPDGDYFLVRNLPVYRCTECGEITIPAESIEKVEKIVEEQDPDEIQELPIYNLKKAS